MQRENRRLAAIVAADIAGYSRLIGQDEEGTLRAMRAHRRDLIDRLIDAHGGRIANTAGDSLLLEFASAVDAVRCAVAMQHGMAERNGDIAADRQIRFRIGIHVGDVVAEGGDLLGDGVNIAARLEALSQPGGVILSDDAYRQVRDRLDLTWQDGGEHAVKNIARPIQMWRWESAAQPGTMDGPAGDKPPAPPDKPSIAVLPFANMSGSADQEYFSDGITEDIITGLSRNRAFFVISRSTSFTYKGAAVDLAGIARELDVRYVLEGSVRRAGNRVRITAQLIDATTDHHVWADRYDRELEDIFAVQDEITRNIIGSISPGILSAEIQRARRKEAHRLDSWDFIMRAHWHIRRFTRDDNAEARRLLAQALALDPGSATALGDLAFAHHFDAVFGWTDAPARSHAELGDAARKAVGADDHDAVAHTALAIFDLFSSRHDDAVRRLQRAIDLNPNLAFARGYLGTTFAFGGQHDAAMENLEEVIRLSPRDPLMVIWRLSMAWAALLAERYDEAAGYAGLAIEDNPEFTDNYTVLAAARGQLGEPRQAKAALDELLSRMPGLTLGDDRLQRPFRRPADRDRFLDGLRKAGLPE